MTLTVPPKTGIKQVQLQPWASYEGMIDGPINSGRNPYPGVAKLLGDVCDYLGQTSEAVQHIHSGGTNLSFVRLSFTDLHFKELSVIRAKKPHSEPEFRVSGNVHSSRTNRDRSYVILATHSETVLYANGTDMKTVDYTPQTKYHDKLSWLLSTVYEAVAIIGQRSTDSFSPIWPLRERVLESTSDIERLGLTALGKL